MSTFDTYQNVVSRAGNGSAEWQDSILLLMHTHLFTAVQPLLPRGTCSDLVALLINGDENDARDSTVRIICHTVQRSLHGFLGFAIDHLVDRFGS